MRRIKIKRRILRKMMRGGSILQGEGLEGLVFPAAEGRDGGKEGEVIDFEGRELKIFPGL